MMARLSFGLCVSRTTPRLMRGCSWMSSKNVLVSTAGFRFGTLTPYLEHSPESFVWLLGSRGVVDLQKSHDLSFSYIYHLRKLLELEIFAQLVLPYVGLDRKSTRLNSSHLGISYAV